jgi:DNA-binding MarR family transcriptional regulator
MPTQRPLLFNPHQASTQELEATLVRNGSLLETIERDLLEDQRRHTPRHWQVIGPRGSGKSHLTELLLRHMREQHEWRVVRLPEEHYQTASVAELLEQILIRLSDKPSPYADVRDPIQLEELVLTDLKRTRNIGHRPILVVAENLPLLLEHQLSSTRDQARLRQILTTDPPFIVIATATSHLFATRDHSAPFYDFFQTLVLDDLTREEISELVMARAKWDDATELLSTWGRVSSQLDAIYHLSGGNPRLVVALYNVLREGVTSELHSQFVQLLDEVTPYFQDRLRDVAPQAARILAIMAVADGPITPAEIARRCRMSTNQVTAQIQKLQDQRLVVPGGRPNLRSRYYEIKDRLFRIWLQMREDRALRGKLHFLVEFYQRWYGERFDQLELATRKLTETLWENLDTGDKARCSDCLRTLDYLGSAVNWDAEVLVSKALGDIVDVPNGDVPTLREKREKLLELYRDPRFHPNRELLGFMIALISDWLDEGDHSLAILRELVEHGAQSEQVLSSFIRHLIEHDEYTEAWDRAQALAISNPNSSTLTEVAALAAVSAGKIDDGLALAREALKTGCKSCRQRISVQMARALSKRDEIDRVLPLFAEAIGSPAAQAEESLVAIAKIAVGKKLAKKDFLLASKLWTHLSNAPPWFLQSGVCRLSHIEGAAPLALEYLSAIADTLSVGFLQPAVDHLIEVAAQLQAEAEKNPGSRAIRERALSLIESRTDPKHLAAAFRRQAPYLARRRPQLRIHLLELYQQLRDRGLLEADISPYAEARTVMKSSDKDNAMISLHPEVREAVALLLSGERRSIAPDSRGASVAD